MTVLCAKHIHSKKGLGKQTDAIAEMIVGISKPIASLSESYTMIAAIAPSFDVVCTTASDCVNFMRKFGMVLDSGCSERAPIVHRRDQLIDIGPAKRGLIGVGGTITAEFTGTLDVVALTIQKEFAEMPHEEALLLREYSALQALCPAPSWFVRHAVDFDGCVSECLARRKEGLPLHWVDICKQRAVVTTIDGLPLIWIKPMKDAQDAGDIIHFSEKTTAEGIRHNGPMAAFVEPAVMDIVFSTVQGQEIILESFPPGGTATDFYAEVQQVSLMEIDKSSIDLDSLDGVATLKKLKSDSGSESGVKTKEDVLTKEVEEPESAPALDMQMADGLMATDFLKKPVAKKWGKRLYHGFVTRVVVSKDKNGKKTFKFMAHFIEDGKDAELGLRDLKDCIAKGSLEKEYFEGIDTALMKKICGTTSPAKPLQDCIGSGEDMRGVGHKIGAKMRERNADGSQISSSSHHFLPDLEKEPTLAHNIFGHVNKDVVIRTCRALGFDTTKWRQQLGKGCESCLLANSKKARTGRGLLGMTLPEKIHEPGSSAAVDIVDFREESVTGSTKAMTWVDIATKNVLVRGLNKRDGGKGASPMVLGDLLMTSTVMSGYKGAVTIYSDTEIALQSEEVLRTLMGQNAFKWHACPNESRTNPEIEQIIGTLEAMMRAFMIEAWFPAYLALVMFIHAAFVHNSLKSMEKDGKFYSPSELMTGKPIDVRFLRKPGDMVIFYAYKNDKATVQAKGRTGVYLSSAAVIKQHGFLVYDIAQARIRTVMSVKFVDTQPFKKGYLSRMLHQRLNWVTRHENLPDGSHASEMIDRIVTTPRSSSTTKS